MDSTSTENSEQLRSRIHHLSSEVQRLQRELGDAHSADYNTLKRAYVSLVQHFRALQVEAQVLKAHIDAFDVDVMHPDDVANELTAVAAVAAVATVAARTLRHPRLAPLRVGIWSAGILFLGWRFTSAGFGRLGSLLVRNRQRKRRLQQDWETLTERIRIMDDLTRWEGQDPSLQPPSASPGPSSEGEGSAASGWVDVSHADEGEGKVSYPKPYSPAAASPEPEHEGDNGDGKVGYPRVHGAAQSAEEGQVAYPSLGAAADRTSKGGGGRPLPELPSAPLPSAPPLPIDTPAGEAQQERQRVPAMDAK